MKLPKIPPKLYKKYKVQALYLFGSQAKGKTHAQSDTDLAVRFRHNPTLKEMLKLSNELAPYFSSEIDLVDLADASLPLQYRIFRERRLLYAENPMHESTRRALTLTLYYDYKYYYDRFSKFETDRIAKYGLT